MQVDEPYNPNINSDDISDYLEFKQASCDDVQSVFELMSERNPYLEKGKLYQKVKKEITELNDGKNYGVFVAIYDGQVVGFCRFYHSNSVASEKIKYDSPKGYYLMGICVLKSMRRKGVAKFLSDNRFSYLQSLGAKYAYSCVAIDNNTSQRMHKSFGFIKLKVIQGVLTVNFEPNKGILYIKNLSEC